MIRKQVADKIELLNKYTHPFDPIIDFKTFAALSNFSARQLSRYEKTDENFPPTYGEPGQKKGYKLSEVEKWNEGRIRKRKRRATLA